MVGVRPRHALQTEKSRPALKQVDDLGKEETTANHQMPTVRLEHVLGERLVAKFKRHNGASSEALAPPARGRPRKVRRCKAELGAGAKAELLWYAARVVWIQVAAGSGVLIEHSSEAPSLRRAAKMSHGPRRQY